jgi:hypothetical protein
MAKTLLVIDRKRKLRGGHKLLRKTGGHTKSIRAIHRDHRLEAQRKARIARLKGTRRCDQLRFKRRKNMRQG